jgi:hypothetical protein
MKERIKIKMERDEASWRGRERDWRHDHMRERKK